MNFPVVHFYFTKKQELSISNGWWGSLQLLFFLNRNLYLKDRRKQAITGLDIKALYQD